MDIIYCLARSLSYIEEHLKDKLDLEYLADIANYSPWHFHRQFTAFIGYGVGDYIRRRRLSEASRELIFTDKPIREIARSYQFESQEAFTRSFKNYSGVTPGYARKQKSPLIRFAAINLIVYSKHLRKGDIIMTPRFEHKDTFTVVDSQVSSQWKTTPFLHYGTSSIPALWKSKMPSIIAVWEYVIMIPIMKKVKPLPTWQEGL